MNNRQTQVVILFLAILLGVVVFFSFGLVNNERHTRTQREMELAAKTTELTQTQSLLTNLGQEKAALEKSLNAKIASLESAIAQHEENVKSLSAQIEVLKREKDGLEDQLLDKTKQVSAMSRKILMLEAGKEEFMQTISQLEKQKKELENQVQGSNDAEEAPAAPAQTADTDSVNLGRIILTKETGLAAQVSQVNPAYNFVVINAGQRNGLKKGDVVNIIRSSELISRAVIQQVREDSSAAVALPEWQKRPIQEGDFVTQV